MPPFILKVALISKLLSVMPQVRSLRSFTIKFNFANPPNPIAVNHQALGMHSQTLLQQSLLNQCSSLRTSSASPTSINGRVFILSLLIKHFQLSNTQKFRRNFWASNRFDFRLNQEWFLFWLWLDSSMLSPILVEEKREQGGVGLISFY